MEFVNICSYISPKKSKTLLFTVKCVLPCSIKHAGILFLSTNFDAIYDVVQNLVWIIAESIFSFFTISNNSLHLLFLLLIGYLSATILYVGNLKILAYSVSSISSNFSSYLEVTIIILYPISCNFLDKLYVYLSTPPKCGK